MDMECKKFSKDIRGLDKEMRTWDAFNGLEVTVKNMLTSLRAVGELQACVILHNLLICYSRFTYIKSIKYCASSHEYKSDFK